MNIMKYFKVSEFSCKCNDENCLGKTVVPSFDLLNALDSLRERAGCPIDVNSGLRCAKHNLKEGGSKNSRHLPEHADAADIVIRGKSVREMLELALKIDVFRYGGIGIYSNRIHVDTRNYTARWPKGMWTSETEFITYDEMEKTE